MYTEHMYTHNIHSTKKQHIMHIVLTEKMRQKVLNFYPALEAS